MIDTFLLGDIGLRGDAVASPAVGFTTEAERVNTALRCQWAVTCAEAPGEVLEEWVIVVRRATGTAIRGRSNEWRLGHRLGRRGLGWFRSRRGSSRGSTKPFSIFLLTCHISCHWRCCCWLWCRGWKSGVGCWWVRGRTSGCGSGVSITDTRKLRHFVVFVTDQPMVDTAASSATRICTARIIG